jgi:hypothetical protein
MAPNPEFLDVEGDQGRLTPFRLGGANGAFRGESDASVASTERNPLKTPHKRFLTFCSQSGGLCAKLCG